MKQAKIQCPHCGKSITVREINKRVEAGAPEIEITPAMITAGVSEYLDFDSRYEHDFGELVTSIYEAMERAKEAGHRAQAWESDRIPFGVVPSVDGQAEALPDRVSWLGGHIYRIVEGQMVVDRLSESEARGLDLSRSELFQAQSHQN
jgi:hypothetical protein